MPQYLFRQAVCFASGNPDTPDQNIKPFDQLHDNRGVTVASVAENGVSQWTDNYSYRFDEPIPQIWGKDIDSNPEDEFSPDEILAKNPNADIIMKPKPDKDGNEMGGVDNKTYYRVTMLKV